MKFKLILLLVVFSLSPIQAENLFQDLDPQRDMKVSILKGFKYVKTFNDEGQISFTIKQASEANNLRMTIAKELQVGQTYHLSFTAIAKGQGQVSVGYGTESIQSKKLKPQQLGLKRSFTTKKEPQSYKCTFKVSKKIDAQAKAVFDFSLGAFQGDLIFKDFKLVQVPNPRKIHGKGVIEQVKAPTSVPVQAKKPTLTKAEKVKAERAAKFAKLKAEKAAKAAKRAEAAKAAEAAKRAEAAKSNEAEQAAPEKDEAISPKKVFINI
ncbi:hypothetical protein LNTAR_07419 [Lentisphaera araneosa HTCC2155]|uniref:Uncharacterized protein n=1 Tax=Lentisphaera araneosa HTCC2155 TaxID=313628 RepID=A6DN19_9BACT|nr:hypothetical protein LNTAR_07419 [Lentisphaera araneosa HTCC2155]